MDFHADDEFKEFSFRDVILSRHLQASTAIEFLNELEQREQVNPNWKAVLGDIEVSVLDEVLTNITADFRRERLWKHDWWLVVGSFIVW